MIVVMEKDADRQELDEVLANIRKQNIEPVAIEEEGKTIIAINGKMEIEKTKGIEKILDISKPFKLVSRERKPEGTSIKIRNLEIGNGTFLLIAGPCSLETRDQAMESAKILKSLGVKVMRASVFKPRSSPYSFQGMGIEGLRILKNIREMTGLLVETEVMDVRDVKIASEHVDILRVGARNMQNYDLLKELGKVKTPVILKRGISATIEELLLAAEYILSSGNPNVILCERGIRTFETKSYRNTLDIGAIPVLKRLTHLPVIVDPSHAAGNRELVIPLSKAAVAAGADGLLVEMHPDPDKAWSDGEQSLFPRQLSQLIDEIKPLMQHG
ncbi:MAG: 3-deoxy-7-phosphoheptulonate synthase [Candidatus Woesearchaeota archaeon]|nr:3-deoxy-7-phosphoheptulonate synthase [Candidatus Woesearchaeota archaeon]